MDDIYNSTKKQKKVIGYLFIFILLIQFVLFSYLKNYSNDTKSFLNESKNIDCELQESIINNNVRSQMRRSLESIREGWVVYLQHNNIELLMKKSNKYIFSNESGQNILFDENTMQKIKRFDKYYDIYDKEGKLLISKVRPEWNIENVKKILNTIASPIRAFGPTGDVLVFDTNTGEIIIDNSEDCKNSNKVLEKNNKRYVTLDYKHPNNRNPKMTKDLIDSHFLWKSDSDSSTKMTYMFNEPTVMNNPNDFLKYPLGDYNREFQEKIILPYQTVGIDGQDMQITIILGAQEKEIYDAYKKWFNSYRNLYTKTYDNNSKLIYIPTISVLASLMVMAITFFGLTINNFLCAKRIKDFKNKK